jgi:hypothetical protein
MTMRTVWYRCLTHCEESFFVFRTTQADFDRWTAQEAAGDYHHAHDGWEANWPLEFALHETENGPEIARFEVHREVEPVFYATAIAKAEGK